MRTIMDVERDLYFARGYFSATGDPSDGQVVEMYEQELRKLELLQCLEFNRSYREQYADVFQNG